MADDERIVDTVGTCCDIYEKYMFDRPWYQWRNRCLGTNGAWESELYKARETAENRGNCTPASSIYITVKNKVTGDVLEDIRVCLGMMCTQTAGTGETYIGRYAYGSYGLTIAANGYENLVETFVVAASEYHLVRELVPTGEVDPGEGCDSVPSWLRPFCVLFVGWITAAITAFNAAVIIPIQKFQDDAWKVTLDLHAVTGELVSGLVAETQARIDSVTALDASLRAWVDEVIQSVFARIQTDLINPILETIEGLWEGIEELWLAAEEIIAAAEEEATAWREKITTVDLDIRAWVTESIFEILMKKLDEGAKDVRSK